jgi:hypothetical protein
MKTACESCGRAVWLRRIGTTAYPKRGVPVYAWCGRKGSTIPPIYCKGPDGKGKETYHTVDGHRRTYDADKLPREYKVDA